jgi:hypothetical protein
VTEGGHVAAPVIAHRIDERRFTPMVLKKRTTLPVALAASIALALPAAGAEAQPSGPVAHSAGGDAAPLNPAVVGIPITRTQAALDNAADAVDEGQGATAAGPLRASRRNLIRSYRGARYLIAHMPPPAAEEAKVGSRKFIRMARSFIRATRNGNQRGWIRAQASGDGAGPVFADAATAVFNVFTSQYSAATAAVGMLPDVTGNLVNRVNTTLNTAIVLRNRLVKVVAAAAPPAPEEARAAQEAEEVTTFDVVMPGLTVLLDDEIQQIQATTEDTSVPAGSKAALANALAADQQIEQRVNTLWPPATED